MTPAIVLATYNRLSSFKRLLSSIEQAEYNIPDIPLVISIDGGGNNNAELVAISESFEWKHGEKRIIQHKENLGLRKHILSCGDLTEQYGAICLFEDDIYAQKNFYTYFSKAVQFYKNDENVAGISLYSYSKNVLNGKPFIPLKSEYDTFFMQFPASWGQGWTSDQWNGFRNWYNKGQQILEEDKIPIQVKRWPETSWLKYFTKYITESKKYIAYPYAAFSTNFNDAGTHASESNSTFQSNMYSLHLNLNFAPTDDIQNIKYDNYFELLPSIFKKYYPFLQDKDFEVDLYGLKSLSCIKSKYLLSSKQCISALKQFSLKLKPHEQNILCDINEKPSYFSFAKLDSFIQNRDEVLSFEYYYHIASLKITALFLKKKLINGLKKKLL